MRGFFRLCTIVIILTSCRVQEPGAIQDVQLKRFLTDFNCSPQGLDGACFQCTIKQPDDHFSTLSDSFPQYFLLRSGISAGPIVIHWNGYAIDSIIHPRELEKKYGGHVFELEHRFFGRSIPSDDGYRTLDIAQATADQHRFYEQVEQYFEAPILTTGISKGGQAAIYHRCLYPEDRVATVAYVAPLANDCPDRRIDRHLLQVGSDSCRRALKAIQREILGHPEAIQRFNELAGDLGMEFDMSSREALEWSVLEFEFAFWQWDAQCEALHPCLSNLDTALLKVFETGAPSFFSKATRASLYPFFYQAYSEMGMYSYSTDGLLDVLKEVDAEADPRDVFLSPEHQDIPYNGSTHRMIMDSLIRNSDDLIVIQGEVDPWSAAFDREILPDDQLYTVAGGTHRSRITDLPAMEQEKIWRYLSSALEHQH